MCSARLTRQNCHITEIVTHLAWWQWQAFGWSMLDNRACIRMARIFFFPLPTLTHKWHSPSEENGQDNNITIDYNEHQSNLVVLLCCIILVSAPVWLCAWSRILVQVTIYLRFLIGRDGHLDQSEAYDIS